MKTDCNTKQLHFQGLEERKVVAAFEGGTITSDAGGSAAARDRDDPRVSAALLRVLRRSSGSRYVEHSLTEMVTQRVVGLCLGYEDLNDHDELRRDPLLATVCGKLDPSGQRRRQSRDRGAPLAGKSTLNRLETFGAGTLENQKYKRIEYIEQAVDELLVDAFLDSYRKVPQSIVLDIDPTDDELHGHQEGRFFHGYCYCYLPLYMYCGDHLLYGKLKTANLDPGSEALPDLQWVIGRIRARWPKVKITVRADSGFCREELMRWCENNGIFYVFGLARNPRLVKRILKELKKARQRYYRHRQAQRIYKDFSHLTLESWSRPRRVIGKAEYLTKGENPRFVVTNLPQELIEATELYESLYCARGDMENRIKEQQLDLFADRTSSFTMRANQLRLYFSCLAYLLMSELRRRGLERTQFAKAQCQTIRLKMLKIGGPGPPECTARLRKPVFGISLPERVCTDSGQPQTGVPSAGLRA